MSMTFAPRAAAAAAAATLQNGITQYIANDAVNAIQAVKVE
jgi:hypothetical protein